MNFEKVVFAFFILLAATLNFGFVWGDIHDVRHHGVWEFFAVCVVALITTVLKFGDRTHVGSIHLATSLVARLQLSAAAMVRYFVAPVMMEKTMARIRSLSAGELLANRVSVIILIAETTSQRR